MIKDSKQMTKILIVDDVQLNLDMMKEILSEKEYMIATAINGKSAIAKAKAHKFDLILLDVVLPDVDGFEVYSHLKSNQQTHDIPIIFLIEKKDTDSINKGFQLGAVDYVSKPFSKEELLHKVNFHLMHRKTQDELIRLKSLADVAVNAKNNFLANISHEIRTPMNGIIGMVDVLKLSQLTEEQHEYLEIIGMSGDNLLIIINDLLDLSRMEAGQIIINKIKFNLFDLVNEVIVLIRHKAIEKKLELSFVIDPEVPQFLIGDPSRLKQVFINLCNNAVKFTDIGSIRIHVGFVDANESTIRLYFEIQDTGIGISIENQ